MLKLYYFTNACSLASHIALEDVGADYEAIRVDFTSNAQREDTYLDINPKGRVPALITAEGVITENPAILMYIAHKYPGSNLAPLYDAYALAQVLSFNAYLSSTVHVAHAHGPRGSRWADDPETIAELGRKVPENMKACFELIENTMFKSPWVMGDQYTICDPYLFTIAQWLEADGVDPAAFPKVHDHRKRMLERASVQKVMKVEKN